MNGVNERGKIYQFNGIFFDPIKHELLNAAEGTLISLSYTESKILELFLQSHGEVINKENILKYAWGGRVVADASVAKSISNLRITIKQCGVSEDVIITAPRMGYKFAGLVESEDEKPVDEPPLQTLSATEDSQPSPTGYIEREDNNAPPFIINWLTGMNNKIFKSKKLYVIVVFFIFIFLMLGAINTYTYVNATTDKFYIDSEYEKTSFNRNFLIHKKSKDVPRWLSKVESEMQPGNTIFFNESEDFIEIGIYRSSSISGSMNYSFSKDIYNTDFIVKYLTSEIKNEK